MQIKNIGTEKFTPDDTDLIPIQETNGATRRIKRVNFLSGINTSIANASGVLAKKTILLSHFDTDFSDAKGHSFTTSGTPLISNSKSFFPGKSSLYLPGNAWVQYTAHQDFKLNSDFSVEAGVWLANTYSSNNTYAPILNISDGSNRIILNKYRSGYSENGVSGAFYYQLISGSTSITIQAPQAPVYESWNHLAIVRSGTSVYLVLNGVTQDISSIPSTGFKFTSNPSVYVGYQVGQQALTGCYLSEVRITSTDFSLPTFQYQI